MLISVLAARWASKCSRLSLPKPILPFSFSDERSRAGQPPECAWRKFFHRGLHQTWDSLQHLVYVFTEVWIVEQFAVLLCRDVNCFLAFQPGGEQGLT
jgi:hypothetical protein